MKNTHIMRLFLAVCLGFMLFCSDSQAQSRGCPPRPSQAAGKITLKLEQPALTYDYTKSREEIAKLAEREVTPGIGYVILGLTKTRVISGIEGDMIIGQRADGKYCIWPNQFTARLGYPSMDVYVDNRYSQKSCEFKTILDHEYQHVKVNYTALNRYAPMVQSALQGVMKRSFHIIANSSEEGQDKAMSVMSNALKTLADRVAIDRDRGNARLDTPENYRATQARCKNW